jgi:hypothetical protein
MEQLIHFVARSTSNYPKALFLMVSGIIFVFIVQVVFFLVIKLWPKPQAPQAQ